MDGRTGPGFRVIENRFLHLMSIEDGSHIILEETGGRG